MEMKIFETTFHPYEDLKILGMLFTSHITPRTTLVMSNAYNACLEFATPKRGAMGYRHFAFPDPDTESAIHRSS